MPSWEFWVLLAFEPLIYLVLIWLGNRFFPNFLLTSALARAVMGTESTYTRQDRTIKILQARLDDKDREIERMGERSAQRDEMLGQLREELRDVREQLAQEQQEMAALRKELEQKRVIQKAPQTRPVSILAIWPTPPDQPVLDQDAEADAFYNAGYAYSALRGIRANRAGVILELDRIKPTVIQVGGHGNSDGILLSDGLAEPGWWGELVRGKEIDLMVLLSCDSGQQDELNISDALIRAGVRAVISCDGSISDVDAVRFAQLLYNKLSDGLSLQQAVQRSKLAVSRKAAEMIRLREK